MSWDSVLKLFLLKKNICRSCKKCTGLTKNKNTESGNTKRTSQTQPKQIIVPIFYLKNK